MKQPALKLAQRAALAAGVVILLALSWLGTLDAPAERQVDAGLKRALLSFATARALNAVISVAQGTEIALQPAGVGLTLTPGQVLDPVNDVVEQFSNLMLVAAVSFGMQKALIAIGGYWPVSLLLSLAALAWALFRFRKQAAPAWILISLTILLMIRFSVPAATLGSDLLFEKFLASDYQASQRILDAASGRLETLNPPAAVAAESPGMLERFRAWWSQKSDGPSRFEQLKQAAEQAIEHIIRLMVIFLLQTLVIPLALLWAFYAVLRRAVR